MSEHCDNQSEVTDNLVNAPPMREGDAVGDEAEPIGGGSEWYPEHPHTWMDDIAISSEETVKGDTTPLEAFGDSIISNEDTVEGDDVPANNEGPVSGQEESFGQEIKDVLGV